MVLPGHSKAWSSHIALLNMTNQIAGREGPGPVKLGGSDTLYSEIPLLSVSSKPPNSLPGLPNSDLTGLSVPSFPLLTSILHKAHISAPSP